MSSLIIKIIAVSLVTLLAGCAIFVPDSSNEPVRRGSLKDAMSNSAERDNRTSSIDARYHAPQRDVPDKQEQRITSNRSSRTVHETGSMVKEDGAAEKDAMRDRRSVLEQRPLRTAEGNSEQHVLPSRIPVREQHSPVQDGVAEPHNLSTKLPEFETSYTGYVQVDDIAEDSRLVDEHDECPDAYLRFKEMEQEYGRPQMWQGCDGAYLVSKGDQDDHHDDSSSGYHGKYGGLKLGIKTSVIPVRSNSIHQIREYSDYLEGSEGDYVVGAALEIASYEFNSGTIQEKALHDTSSYGWSLYIKSYMNSRKVFISPYLLVGVGAGTLRWSYNQPLIDSDGYVIDSDSLGYFDLRFGLGTEVARSYRFNLTISAEALWRSYDSYTRQGFSNDMFSSHFSPAYGASLKLGL